MAFPLLLVEIAALVQVHANEPVQHFRVVDLAAGQFAVVVLAENNLAIDQHGRTAGPIFILKRSQGLLPQSLSLQVIANQPTTAKEHVEPFAVAGGSRRGWVPRGLVILFDAFRRRDLLP